MNNSASPPSYIVGALMRADDVVCRLPESGVHIGGVGKQMSIKSPPMRPAKYLSGWFVT